MAVAEMVLVWRSSIGSGSSWAFWLGVRAELCRWRGWFVPRNVKWLEDTKYVSHLTLADVWFSGLWNWTSKSTFLMLFVLSVCDPERYLCAEIVTSSWVFFLCCFLAWSFFLLRIEVLGYLSVSRKLHSFKIKYILKKIKPCHNGLMRLGILLVSA